MQADSSAVEQPRSFTVNAVAARLIVSPDKVRHWINIGELAAVNVASTLTGRPQLRVTPESLREFEQRRTAGPLPKPQRRRRRTTGIDYFPDD